MTNSTRTRAQITQDLESFRVQREADDLHERLSPVEIEWLDENIRDCEAELEGAKS